MKKLFLVSILIFVGFTNISLACARFEFGVPVCAKFTRADAVFIGKAVKTENLTGHGDYPAKALKVQFKVEQRFKGAENSTFTLITNDWKTACGLKIEKGQRWIIFADYDDEDKTFIGNTGYKYNLNEFKENLKILKAASERKTDPTISGQLISYAAGDKYIYEPAEITVEGYGNIQTSMTDAEGKFNLTRLTAGNYKVKIQFPFRAEFTTLIPNIKSGSIEQKQTYLEYEVELKQGDCNYSFFEIFRYSSNRI